MSRKLDLHTLLFGITLLLACLCNRAGAWGAEGHRTVGELAQQLLEGSRAGSELRALLGELSLADAALWADCAKGVVSDETNPGQWIYAPTRPFPECQIFETSQGKLEMIDFVRRNRTSCDPAPNEEECHRQYHYTDLNITQAKYRRGVVGARNHDVVAAITAMVQVLQGKVSPPPFDIKSKREAVLLLAHYVGDIHQPLHVGAVYLSAAGLRIDPDSPEHNDPHQVGWDSRTETRGGNELLVQTRRLHSLWDEIEPSQRRHCVDAKWLALARAVPSTGEDPAQFSTAWATESLRQSREAFRAMSFAPRVDKQWAVSLPSDYQARMALVKKAQLTAAGAHLAEVLRHIWPEPERRAGKPGNGH